MTATTEAVTFDPTTITDEAILNTLKAVVEEKPDYVYSAPDYQTDNDTSCFYVHSDEDGNPVGAGCIVGAVLHRLGVPLKWLSSYEGERASVAAKKLGLLLDRKTAKVLDGAQSFQDDGSTWGEAYIRATGEPI